MKSFVIRARRVALVAVASCLAAADVASGAGASDHDTLDAILAFKRQFVVDAYRAHGHRDARWDADVVAFLEAQIGAHVNVQYSRYYRDDGAMPVADRLALAKKIRDAGCDDAIFLYHAGLAWTEAGETATAKAVYAKAYAAAERSAYVPLYRLLIVRAHHDATGCDEKSPEAIEMHQRLDRHLRETVADAATLPTHRRAVWEIGDAMFVDSRQRMDAFGKALDGVADADPWLYHTFMGGVEVNRAWAARGTKFAGEVKPEGWQGLAEHLALARRHYAAAIAADDANPVPFAEMITVSMGESAGEERAWFDRAIARQVDHAPAWSHLRYSLWPRWHGSHAEMIALADEAVRGGEFETRAPATALDTVDSIENDQASPLDAEQRRALDPIIVRCLDGYIAQSPLPSVRRWARSARAAWAARMGRWGDAGAQLAALADEGQSPDVEAFERWSLDVDDVRGQAAAYTGARAAAVAQALAEPTPRARVAAIDPVLAEWNADDAGRQWLARRRADADLAARTAGGGWASVVVPPDLAGWRVAAGEWSVDADGALVGKASGGLNILAPFDLPARYELRCTVACLDRPAGVRRTVRIAPAWSRVEPVEVRVAVEDGQGTLIRRYAYGNWPLMLDADGAATIHVRVDGDEVSVLGVDGKAVVAKAFDDAITSRRLNFGGLARQTGPVWRFSNIEIRVPPADDADAPE